MVLFLMLFLFVNLIILSGLSCDVNKYNYFIDNINGRPIIGNSYIENMRYKLKKNNKF